MEKHINVGDRVGVTLKDGRKFESIVVESYDGGFACKVLNKSKDIGVATWQRYSLNEDARFQPYSECESVVVLASSKQFEGSGTMNLNESVVHDKMKFYVTPLEDGKCFTFCECNGYGGWAIHPVDKTDEALKESYFNSQISKLTN